MLGEIEFWRDGARATAATVAQRPDGVRRAALDARLTRMEAIVDAMERLCAEARGIISQEPAQ